MKNFKKNQVVIFVIALMLVTAGYLNFTNNQENQNLIPTSTLADSEQIASIGDATLVSANESKNTLEETEKTNTAMNEVQQEKDNSGVKQEIIESKDGSIAEEKNNEIAQENKVESNNSKPANTTEQSNDNYFTQSKLDRDTMYSQMLSNYQTIIESTNVASDEKKIAQEEIKRINSEKNAIMIAENLIKTKGFEDVVIFVNNGSISTIIKAEKLEKEQVAQLQNIITRELAVEANKINISNKK